MRARWALDGPLLGKFCEHSSWGTIRLVFTLVTIGEIERGIREAACEAARHVRKLRTMPGAKYLHVSGRIPKSRSDEEVAATAVEHFRKWLHDAKAEIIDLGSVPAEAVFVRYFRGAPPFGAGAKKSEFPDAFTILALHQWCHEHNRSVYVVSQDGDLRRACEAYPELIYVERGEELLDLLVRDRSAFGMWASASLAFSSLTEHVQDIIAEEILQRRFVVIGAIGTVESVHIEKIDITDTFVLSVGHPFRYSCEVTIRAKVDLTYIDSHSRQVERIVPMMLDTPVDVEIDPADADTPIMVQLPLEDEVLVSVD